MKLSERVASALRCPRCGAELGRKGPEISCGAPGCGGRFRIQDGIPVLVDEQHALVDLRAMDGSQPGGTSGSALRARAKGWLPRLEGNVSSPAVVRRVSDLLFARTGNPLVLNIAGKQPGATLAGVWRDPRVECVEIDVNPTPGTVLIAAFDALPFADETFDAVILDAVLEHVVEPGRVVAEVHRVLGPAGLVYSDAPFMLQVHAGAYDFHRFSHLAHRRLFRRFEEVDSGISQGPGVALAYAVQYFALSFVQDNRGRYAVKVLARLLLFWLKYVDRYLVRCPGAYDAALGFYLIGRKQAAALDDRTLLESYRGISPDLHARPRS